MILLGGIPSETPLRMVADRLDHLGVDYRWFNQRHAGQYSLAWEVVAGKVRGDLQLGKERHRLADVMGVYIRLMDDRLLPELANESDDSVVRRQMRRWEKRAGA